MSEADEGSERGEEAPAAESEAQAQSRFRRLFRQFSKASAGVFLANGLALPLGFAIHLFLARLLGKDSYGEYSLGLTCANLLAIPVCFGLHTGTVRYLPAYDGTGEFGKLAGFLRFSRRLCLAIAISVSLLAVFGVWVWDWGLSPSLERTLYCVGVLLPVLALFTIYCAFLQSQRRVVIEAVTRGLIRPIAFLAGIALASSLLQAQPMAGFVVLIETFALLLALTSVGLATRRLLPGIWDLEPVYEFAKWIQASFRLVVLQGTVVLQNSADILLVGVFLGAPEAGLYAIARRLARLVDFLLEAMTPFVAPVAAKYFAQGRLNELKRLVYLATILTGIAGVLLAGAMALLGETLLSFFGSEFTAAHQALSVLLLGHALNAMTGPAGSVLVMTGHERVCTIILGTSTILNIAINLVVIHRAGLLGAAWTNAICLAGWNLAVFFYLTRVLNRPPPQAIPPETSVAA